MVNPPRSSTSDWLPLESSTHASTLIKPATITINKMSTADPGGAINDCTMLSPTPEEVEQLSIWDFTMSSLEEVAINASAIFDEVPEGLPINTWIMPTVVIQD